MNTSLGTQNTTLLLIDFQACIRHVNLSQQFDKKICHIKVWHFVDNLFHRKQTKDELLLGRGKEFFCYYHLEKEKSW